MAALLLPLRTLLLFPQRHLRFGSRLYVSRKHDRHRLVSIIAAGALLSRNSGAIRDGVLLSVGVARAGPASAFAAVVRTNRI
jgi:hypothetical protein